MLFGMAFIGFKMLLEVPLRIHNKCVRDIRAAYAAGQRSQ